MKNYNESILLVEDDLQIQKFIKYSLDAEGFKVFASGTAQGALNFAVSEQIDLIILSTTGFSTVSYSDWPPFSMGAMILLMMIGGGIGSTAGGIKLTRIYLMLRITKENIRKRISPARSVNKPYYFRAQGKTYINEAIEMDTTGFVSAYFIIFIIGTLLLTLTASCSLTEAMFEFASTLGTVGLSTGLTNSGSAAGTLIVQMVGMMLGRLEIFIVIIGIYSGGLKLKQWFRSRWNH